MIKDQDNDMSHKTAPSLLEYENSFSKEEPRNEQLIIKKLLDLISDKINAHKPSEQSTIHKGNVTRSSNDSYKKILIIRNL